jgi:hypothetical protein
MLQYTLTRTIDLDAWDGLVQKTYGRLYSLQQQDDCKGRGTEKFSVPYTPWDYENDTVPEVVNGEEMGVSFKAWLARDPEQKIPAKNDYHDGTSLFWERNFYPSLGMVAQDLYEKGLIEAGTYTIVIDW